MARRVKGLLFNTPWRFRGGQLRQASFHARVQYCYRLSAFILSSLVIMCWTPDNSKAAYMSLHDAAKLFHERHLDDIRAPIDMRGAEEEARIANDLVSIAQRELMPDNELYEAVARMYRLDARLLHALSAVPIRYPEFTERHQLRGPLATPEKVIEAYQFDMQTHDVAILETAEYLATQIARHHGDIERGLQSYFSACDYDAKGCDALPVAETREVIVAIARVQ